MKNFQIPSNVKVILDCIHEAGEEAYIVGGCVRDLLLGMEPNDWDITTSALPEKVKSLFVRTIDTGLEHGTVTVMMDKEGYEVTTYRVDGEYEDHRRPDQVAFTRSLSEDLLRRDFTINAMAYNEEEGIVDLYGGLEHLDQKLITCVGRPMDRFNEDALRMLRAIRFSAKLGFDIAGDTYDAIKKLAPLIEHVSAERIQVELNKTLISKEPGKIEELVNTGLHQYIVPEIESVIGMEQNNPYHCYPVDQHIYRTLAYSEPSRVLRWALYLHDFGKGTSRTTDDEGVDHFYNHPEISESIAKTIMKRLKFDNKSMSYICRLIRYHDHRFVATKKAVRRGLNQLGTDLFDDYLKLREADIKAQHPDKEAESLSNLAKVKKLYLEIMEEDSCLSIKDLAVSGREMMELGYKGKSIGDVLDHLLDQVLDEPALNEREKLMEIAEKWQS